MAAHENAIRTIVVDDSPSALRATCSVVARQPELSLVGTASNGREALDLARAVEPDLVLLDLEMPVMDGIEAAAHLHREHPALRVVIVTVHDTPELRRLCRERGARGFIVKDSLNDELPKVLQDLPGRAD